MSLEGAFLVARGGLDSSICLVGVRVGGERAGPRPLRESIQTEVETAVKGNQFHDLLCFVVTLFLPPDGHWLHLNLFVQSFTETSHS